jgi:hypothetical protein
MDLTKMFNENLNNYIRDSGGRNRASEKSINDIINLSDRSRGLLRRAKMYSFQYFTKNETFYDSNPLVIGLGKVNGINQLAINLHYMPYDVRRSFLEDLLNSLTRSITKQINGPKLGNPSSQNEINFVNWENVEIAFGKKYNLKYCVRQYRMDRMKKQYQIGYENWYLGCVNDQNRFIGGDIGNAQSLYYKNI